MTDSGLWLRTSASTSSLVISFCDCVVSFFADFSYEGARSITGPYLAMLGASATLVGFIAGLGEPLGCGLRLVSGRLSERTGEFWPITKIDYQLPK
jgi:hypothetical protein